jgi:hypothetical protein
MKMIPHPPKRENKGESKFILHYRLDEVVGHGKRQRKGVVCDYQIYNVVRFNQSYACRRLGKSQESLGRRDPSTGGH